MNMMFRWSESANGTFGSRLSLDLDFGGQGWSWLVKTRAAAISLESQEMWSRLPEDQMQVQAVVIGTTMHV